MFLKNRIISSKIKRSKVTDYAALSDNWSLKPFYLRVAVLVRFYCSSIFLKFDRVDLKR